MLRKWFRWPVTADKTITFGAMPCIFGVSRSYLSFLHQIVVQLLRSRSIIGLFSEHSYENFTTSQAVAQTLKIFARVKNDGTR